MRTYSICPLLPSFAIRKRRAPDSTTASVSVRSGPDSRGMTSSTVVAGGTSLEKGSLSTTQNQIMVRKGFTNQGGTAVLCLRYIRKWPDVRNRSLSSFIVVNGALGVLTARAPYFLRRALPATLARAFRSRGVEFAAAAIFDATEAIEPAQEEVGA